MTRQTVTVTIIIVIALLAGCGSESVATGLLVSGNVGSTAITLFVDGERIETIQPGNETANAYVVGHHTITFRTATGQTIVDCERNLIIRDYAEATAYCAE